MDKRTIELAGRRADLEKEAALAYARVFSEAELNAIAEFYKGEAGKKLLENGPIVTREVVKAAGIWRNGVTRDLGEAVSKDLQAAAASRPKPPAAPAAQAAPAKGSSSAKGAAAAKGAAPAKGTAPDPHWGVTLRYANPLDGGWAMPTISSWMTHLPAGFVTAPMRSTDGLIVAVAEGRGSVKVGDQKLAFGPRDVFVVPNWTWRQFEAAEDCFLFCCSDRVAQEKLGLWRDERAAAAGASY